MKSFGTKRDVSDIAAHSLQAGMTLRELQRLAKTVGKPIEKAELSAIQEVRKTLKQQRLVAGF